LCYITVLDLATLRPNADIIVNHELGYRTVLDSAALRLNVDIFVNLGSDYRTVLDSAALLQNDDPVLPLEVGYKLFWVRLLRYRKKINYTSCGEPQIRSGSAVERIATKVLKIKALSSIQEGRL
jgi:hypothetical protein